MKKAVPYLITIILILVVGGVFFKLYYDHYMYTNERQDLDAYYGVQDEDDFPVIYENLVSDMHARRFDGACYMDLETVRSLLNSRFYYGTEDNVLIYCLPEEKFVASAGEKSWAGIPSMLLLIMSKSLRISIMLLMKALTVSSCAMPGGRKRWRRSGAAQICVHSAA